jgi:hypothetical protein
MSVKCGKNPVKRTFVFVVIQYPISSIQHPASRSALAVTSIQHPVSHSALAVTSIQHSAFFLHSGTLFVAVRKK